MTPTLYEIALQRKEHRLSEHKKRHKEKQEMRDTAPDVNQKPTLEVWVLFDVTTDVKYIKMNPADGSLAIFDSEEAAIKAKSLTYGTDYEQCEYYSAPTKPVGFCEDTALSLAERTFSTEVDEQLAEDVIQYARRLYEMYTAHHQQGGDL